MKKLLFLFFLVCMSNFAQTESIDAILNEDGTIKTGIDGSYNVDGYVLQYGENNKPKLVKESKSGTNVSWSGLGEGRNGMNGNIQTILIVDDNIYFGGSFTTAGDISAKSIVKWSPTPGGGVWAALGSGLGGGVNAIAMIGTDLYAGGSFQTLGDGRAANRIAKWDGSEWSPLGNSGTTGNGLSSSVRTMAVFKGELYVGGDFAFANYSADTPSPKITVNRIAKWDGTNWSGLRVGSTQYYGIEGIAVYALKASNTDLYVAGNFTKLADYSTVVNRIAKWDGTNWSALVGNGGIIGVSGSIMALAIDDTNLYVGGSFLALGDGTTSAKNIAKWDGTNWSALGDGIGTGDNVVYALVINGTNLYVGGKFSTLGDGATSAKNIAKWDGTNWSALSDGVGAETADYVNALVVSGGVLYVGGRFNLLGDGSTVAKNIVKWVNDNSWQQFNETGNLGTNNLVYSIAVIADDIYIAGSFSQIGDDMAVNRIARWNTVSKAWYRLGDVTNNGVNSTVKVLKEVNGNLYVGGSFTIVNYGGSVSAVGNKTAHYIAKWSPSENKWYCLQGLMQGSPIRKEGLSASVNSFTIMDGELFVGGSFSKRYSGTSYELRYVAKWSPESMEDGEEQGTWSTLGGTTASSTGNGLSGAVNVLVASESALFAGGSFVSAYNSTGTVVVNKIAKWSQTSEGNGTWESLEWTPEEGTTYIGVDGNVVALAVNGNDLYVGGDFNNIGSGAPLFPTKKIAKWNIMESTWTTLGSGVGGGVQSLLVCGNDVYVGGSFTELGDETPANNLAKWNGVEWLPLMDGVNNGVDNIVKTFTLDEKRNRMLIGGNFISCGQKAFFYVAAFTDENNALPVELNTFAAFNSKNGIELSWVTVTEINNYGFEVERKIVDSDWKKIGFVEGSGNSNSPKSYSFRDLGSTSGKIQYRLKQIDTDGGYKYSQIVSIEINGDDRLPKKYSIEQNYPNPFNPSTTINFAIPITGKVMLEIYNLLGQKVSTIINNDLTAGYHSVNFNGSNLASGVYIYRLQAGNFRQAKKMILEK